MQTITKAALAATAAFALAGAALAAPPPAGEPVITPPGKSDAPAGAYSLDRNHSTVVFRLSHLGYSRYTATFEAVEGTLQFDPAHPAAMKAEVKIDPKSLRLPFPPEGFKDTLLGPNWLDAGKYPEITFRSTKVDVTGPNTARVTGDLTLHGVTKPVVLETTFNGGYKPSSFDPGGRIGFSAHTVFRRSDFGVKYGVPAPGTNLGVGDNVDVTIETEWGGKPAAK
jgi:polyisoprenoid-binding protein YceI